MFKAIHKMLLNLTHLPNSCASFYKKHWALQSNHLLVICSCQLYRPSERCMHE